MSTTQYRAAAAAMFVLLPSVLFAGDNSPLHPGLKELGVSGTIYVTHDSPEDLFGVVTLRGGYYFARNQQAGVDGTVFAYSRIQDVYLSGYYRYVFASAERRLAPFAGGSIGANVSRFGSVGSQNSLIVRGETGLRFILTSKFSFDAAYNLMYKKNATLGFTGTTTSILSFGFAWMF